MREMGRVRALFTVEAATQQRPGKLQVDPKGIVGDKHYNKNPERAILITSEESYRLIEEKLNITVPAGYLGENLLIDANPYTLPLGTRLKIGSATLEISQACTLCSHLSVRDKRIPKLLRNDRGIFAKVVVCGEITAKDTVYLLG